VKLKHLDDWTNARRGHAAVYSRDLTGSGLRLLAEPRDCKSVYHIFPLFTEQRDELRKHLHANGISTGIHYPIPVHLQQGFRQLGYEEGSLPQTERVCREVLSLPMYPELANETVKRITDSVLQFCRQSVAACS
jgi:dTDP-4-amino-4,6-dideoxygalactose transaminase